MQSITRTGTMAVQVTNYQNNMQKAPSLHDWALFLNMSNNSVSYHLLKESCEDVTITNYMVIGIEGLIAPWLVIAKDVIVTVTQTLASTEFNIDVTNDMLVTVS